MFGVDRTEDMVHCPASVKIFGFHKSVQFVDQLGNYWLFKKDFAPWSQFVSY